MKVYMVRHGESKFNQSKLLAGWTDTPLTDKGVHEAELARKNFDGVKLDKIFSSDLVRAVKTAQTITGESDFEQLELLREMDIGSLAGKQYSSLSAEDKECVDAGRYAKFGGENNEDFMKRVEAFKTRLESEEGTVGVFTHAGFMRRFFELVIGFPFPRGKMLINNCVTAIFEYENGTWRLHSWINL